MTFWVKLINFAVWVPVVLLYVLFYPFVALYGFLLCLLTWFLLLPKGKDVLIFHNEPQNPGEYFPRLVELASDRAILLDYTDRENWPRSSLPTRLFWRFGPITMPPHLTPINLPAVLVLKKFRYPREFAFGQLAKNKNAKLIELIAALREPRD